MYKKILLSLKLNHQISYFTQRQWIYSNQNSFQVQLLFYLRIVLQGIKF